MLKDEGQQKKRTRSRVASSSDHCRDVTQYTRNDRLEFRQLVDRSRGINCIMQWGIIASCLGSKPLCRGGRFGVRRDVGMVAKYDNCFSLVQVIVCVLLLKKEKAHARGFIVSALG